MPLPKNEDIQKIIDNNFPDGEWDINFILEEYKFSGKASGLIERFLIDLIKNRPVWNKVSDIPPPEHEDFIAYFPASDKYALEMQLIIGWDKGLMCFYNESRQYHINDFTHWMPLLKSPELK